MNELLYCCTFSDASRDPGVTVELLSAMGWDYASRLDAESGETIQTLYFPERTDAEAAKAKLEELRPLWAELEIKFGEVSISELKKENWAESWKIHFKPMEISDRLAIVPSWVKFPAKPGQHVLTLDPGLSFGTGQHATTKFCLSKLDELAAKGLPEGASMLDAGCGSGILAISAVKLGWTKVSAFDIDPDAVRVSKENAETNDVHSIAFAAAPLLEYACDTQFDVVAANILSSALLAGRDKLLSMLKPGGTLILAGILDTEFSIVSKAFCEAGCVPLGTAEESGWRGGIFRCQK